MITLTDKLLSKEAAILYYSLYSTTKYVDVVEQGVKCRLTPNEVNRAIKELQDLELIEVKVSIRKKKGSTK